MNKPMTNNYSSVSSWRDEVSKSLGGMEKGIENIEKKMDGICEIQKKHNGRINTLEDIESNRRAVQKKMIALYSFIVVIITTLSNIAFQVFN